MKNFLLKEEFYLLLFREKLFKYMYFSCKDVYRRMRWYFYSKGIKLLRNDIIKYWNLNYIWD